MLNSEKVVSFTEAPRRYQQSMAGGFTPALSGGGPEKGLKGSGSKLDAWEVVLLPPWRRLNASARH